MYRGKSAVLLVVCQGTWKFANIFGGLRAAPGNLPMTLKVLSMPMEICQCTWKFVNACGNPCCPWKLADPPESWSVPLKKENPCKFYVLGSWTKALEVLTTPESLLMLLTVYPWKTTAALEVCQCCWKSAAALEICQHPWKPAAALEVCQRVWKSAAAQKVSRWPWKSAAALGVCQCP